MECIVQTSEQEPFICINCGSSLPALYEIYGESHLRLLLCQHCNTTADKYIEYDNVLLFIDLILMKPCAYRHTIYNVFLTSSTNPGRPAALKSSASRVSLNPVLRSTKSQNALNIKTPYTSKFNSTSEPTSNSTNSISLTPLVFRLGILMLLFEVYVTWAYQEKSFIEKEDQTSLIISLVLKGPIQYIYFLSATILQNLILCLGLTYFGLQWLPFNETTLVPTFTSSPNCSPLPSRAASPSESITRFSTSNYSSSLLYQLRVPKASYSSSTIQNCNGNNNNNNNYNSNPTNDDKLLDYKILKTPKPPFKKIFQMMITTVLISNIIKLFPIVMLIWPYDSPILHATRFLVRIVHLFLLIEAIYIVFINPNVIKKTSIKNQQRNHNIINAKNYYYNVTAVVLMSELTRIILSHVIIVFFASAIWGISVRDIGLDDWKMFKVGIRMLEELGEYILGEV